MRIFERGKKFKLNKPFGKLPIGTLFEVEKCAYGNVFMHAIVDNKKTTTFGFAFRYIDELFEPYIEDIITKDAATVTEEDINKLLSQSEYIAETFFNKCTVVTLKLPNGFVIVESSACVSPNNYDFEIGKDICLKKIKDKLWELEGYRLQQSLFEKCEE